MPELHLDPPLSDDAAIVLALAETAIAFAASPRDEAERWVRALRLHGEVGCALEALRVPRGPLENGAGPPVDCRWTAIERATSLAARIRLRAQRSAAARRSCMTSTVDVLAAVGEVYGPDLDRALCRGGTSRGALLEQLHERAGARRFERAVGLG